MMRSPIRLGLLLALAACRPTPAPDPNALEPVARRYVVLGLDLGRHDANYVDAYYGPDSLKVVATEGQPEDDVAPRHRFQCVGIGAGCRATGREGQQEPEPDRRPHHSPA